VGKYNLLHHGNKGAGSSNFPILIFFDFGFTQMWWVPLVSD
jgi:hypothetical protein